MINVNQDTASQTPSRNSPSSTQLSPDSRQLLQRGVGSKQVGQNGASHHQPLQNASTASQTTQTNSGNRADRQQENKTFNTSQKLAVLDQVLTQVEEREQVRTKSSLQSQPQTAASQTRHQQVQEVGQDQGVTPPAAGRTRKEGLKAGPISVEAGAGLQYVEQEKSPEIPPDVDKYIKKVGQNKIQPPQEVVVADQSEQTAQSQYAAEPAAVLPITQETEQKGKRKSPKLSIRWLVEWSRKIIKMFSGKVIYRQAA